MSNFFEQLPEQIIVLILKKLTVQDLANISAQNKQLNVLASCDSVWKDLVVRDYDNFFELDGLSHQSVHELFTCNVSWQMCYKVLKSVPSYFFTVANEIHKLKILSHDENSANAFNRSMKAFFILIPVIHESHHLLVNLPTFQYLLEDLYYWFESKPNITLSCCELVSSEDFPSSQSINAEYQILNAVANAISILTNHNFVICPSLQNNLASRTHLSSIRRVF